MSEAALSLLVLLDLDKLGLAFSFGDQFTCSVLFCIAIFWVCFYATPQCINGTRLILLFVRNSMFRSVTFVLF
jgi:hypothetical protein